MAFPPLKSFCNVCGEQCDLIYPSPVSGTNLGPSLLPIAAIKTMIKSKLGSKGFILAYSLWFIAYS